ncbi:hypothetical protein OG417_44890 [Actinoallomurus sp. NBC_01490]|uniref:hypothetical protein n=1 Tax=Actinoallomurus sp. NBC_01490 TaxID=2903557 RepID=UPI002E364400|nr:hypothetical protein [Actinoallomurus sp. NBC_01490]
MSLNQALENLIKDELKAKTFASGSKGFHATGKIVGDDGARYQAQAQAVLIGSKDNPKVKVKATPQEAIAALAGVADSLAPKRFRTGRTGYYATGKTEIAGQRFQVQAQAVQLT